MANYFKDRRQSFAYAFQGLATLWRTQPHAKIHVIMAMLCLSMAAYFELESWEWAALVGCITLVLSAEAFNTALEFLTDLVSPDYHPLAGHAKDLAAGAVLLAAIGALVIGLIIFTPYWQALLGFK
ncbi:MAG: diacylglycerol kinase family protein [Bacteroidetes bacterium]|nr:MAG: diacylglycerol kinase family protein [Bacteroidota bacterium]